MRKVEEGYGGIIQNTPVLFRGIPVEGYDSSSKGVQNYFHEIAMLRRAYCDSYLELQNVQAETKREVSPIVFC